VVLPPLVGEADGVVRLADRVEDVAGGVGTVSAREIAFRRGLGRRERGRLVTSPAELADEFVAVGDLPRRTVEPDFAEYDHDAVSDRYVETYRELVGD